MFRTSTALLAAALTLGSAHAADRVLGQPRLLDNGDIQLGEGLKIGRRGGDGKLVLQPDSIQLLGPGSTAPTPARSDNTGSLATTDWVRSYGSGHASILSCLSPSQIEDVVGNTGATDLTSTVQPCLDRLGAVSVLWPAGTYRISGTLTPPVGQDNTGVGDGWNAGTIIYVPTATSVPTFRLQSAIKVRGFTFRGSTAATAGQSFVQVSVASGQTAANGATIENNFFYGGYSQIDIIGTCFYINIANNKFSGGSSYAIRGVATSGPGFDFTARGNRFLGLTPDRTTSVARLTGLGSALWTDNIVSVSVTGGPSFWIESVASLFGGLQVINSVFEQGGSQPAVYAQGTDRTIPYLHFANNIITAETGNAVLLANTNKARFIGGAISSTSPTGSFRMNAYGTNDLVSLTDVTFEGDAGISPVQAPQDAVGSISMASVKWQGTAPLFDGSGMYPGALRSFDFFGGTPGLAAQPFRLPAGTRASIAYGGVGMSSKTAALPTAGPGPGLYAEYTVPAELVGGTAGSCSRIALGGTSSAYTVIAANVGSGC